MANDCSETAQADGEGPDSSDKPPHGHRRQQPNHHHSSVPLPPPEAGSLPKEPGFTKSSLSSLVGPPPNQQLQPPPLHGSRTPSSSSNTESDTDSASWPPSTPSTRPPSRAPSVSSNGEGLKSSAAAPAVNNVTLTMTPATPISPKPPNGPTTPKKKDASKSVTSPVSSSTPTAAPSPSQTIRANKGRSPSVHSSDGGGHKFTLKELLANGPKLARRSSARSNASSKKSDSESEKEGGGGGRGTTGQARSSAGDSACSLSKKYGVCERVAIGKGATSVVRLAHKWDRSEEKLYAVKEFRKRRKNETEKEYVKKLTAEFCISSALHHTNIVETVDLVQDENQHWCEVMEYCPGGDLYAAIKKGNMSESEAECCFKQILNGVAYLHSQGVAHRDIKPENLFFDARGQLKIGDYGASTVYRLPWESTVHMSTGLCGSEPYIAPEQFSGKPYDARLVDIWACGVVFYCLIFQELPWRVAQTSDPLYAAYAAACASPNLSQSACPTTINNLPRPSRPVIRKMLEPVPKMRICIEDILKNPWVQGIQICHNVEKPTHVHVNARALTRQLEANGHHI